MKIQVFRQEGFVLLSEGGWTLALRGQLYMDLIPLLDGQTHCEDICYRLTKSGHGELATRTALYRLSSKGVTISGEYQLTPEQATLWCHLAITPALAERLLQKLALFVKVLPGVNLEQSLLYRMQSWGGLKLSRHEDEADLIIYLTTGLTLQELAKINRSHLASGQRWCLVQMANSTAFLGPIFHPGQKNRPCWQCLHFRLQQGASSIPYRLGLFSHSGPYQVGELLLGRLHTELSEYLVDNVRAAISGHLIRSPFPYTKGTYHWVGWRPQCCVCGDPSLTHSDRSPRPPQLRSRSLVSRTSGGVRNRSSQQVWRQYQKFLSPLTGVVEKLTTYTDGDDWLFVAQCDSNRAAMQQQLSELKAGFRMKSSGKGSTAEQAQVGSLCESLERYSGTFQGEEEIVHFAKYEDFQEGEAILPNQVMLFSEQQYREREQINKRRINFYRVPHPFDCDAHVRWTPVWSLGQKRFKYMVTQQLYYDAKDKFYSSADSNGCAGGSCLEDAIIQGAYELVERDAFAIWWYNRLQFPALDLDSFDLPYLQQAREFYRKAGRRLWLLDVTHDFEIPCFVALSLRENPTVDPQIIFGSGAHCDPRIAAVRAISEVNQSYICLRPWSSDQSHFTNTFEQITRDWFMQADPRRDSNYHYLLPNDRASTVEKDYCHPGYSDALEEIDFLRKKVRERGMEMLVLDQTRRDIEFPVVKVIVPGMRHFWCRLAAGRLYDVPVAMGWMERPLREDELNPIPLFF